MNEYKLNKLLQEDKHLRFLRRLIKALKQQVASKDK